MSIDLNYLKKRKFILILTLALFIPVLSGCQEDLVPSDEDRRDNDAPLVSAMLEDLSFTYSTGESETLNQRLQTHDAVVLYFTMWCPVCTEHMLHINGTLTERYPNVDFIFVDYLTDSVAQTRSTQLSQGWANFPTISDFDGALEKIFDGTMAITVVIDQNSVVRFNEEYKNGARLMDVLNEF